jgi:hypothetical protein
MPELTPTQRTAVIGDVAVLVLLTVVGFATHATLDAVGRFLVTALSALVAWAAVAPFLGVYDEQTIDSPQALWRVGWAWFLAAPLATFLRGAVLNRDIPWVFVLVTILVNGFGLVAWRIALGWSRARRARLRAGERPL